MTSVLDAVTRVVGAERCSATAGDLLRFGSDFHYDAAQPCAVVRPADLEQLCAVVESATERNTAVVPRGGGVSYTAGYSPDRAGCMLVDTTDLNGVVELSLEDGFVTVEAGCTWERLRTELAPHGVRTTFGGPFSGAFATVGGALSQSAVVWGVGRYGVSANSVLSLGVVCADGSLLHTGHDSTIVASTEADATTDHPRRAAPHFRPYGPDLTGLFLGDCGALGIKATATLRLVDLPRATAASTWSFDTDEGLVSAMVELARRELGGTVVATDATMVRQRIIRAAAERGEPVTDGDHAHTMYVVVDGRTQAGVAAESELVAAICEQHGGGRAALNAAETLVSNPFLTMTSSVGPDGERWAPVHAIAARSGISGLWRDLRELETRYRGQLEAHGVTVAYLLTTVGTEAVIIEPALYWPGRRRPLHDLVLTDDQRGAFPEGEDHPEADGFVDIYRAEMLDVFEAHATAHLQIGRVYPYAKTRDPLTMSLLEAVKAHVDPEGLMNPGVLGLG